MITREGLYASSDTLGAMGDAIEVFLINKGYSRQQSCSAANHIVLGISDNLGGCQGYMAEHRERAPKAVRFLQELTESIEQTLGTIPYSVRKPKNFLLPSLNVSGIHFSGGIYISLWAHQKTLSTGTQKYWLIFIRVSLFLNYQKNTSVPFSVFIRL